MKVNSIPLPFEKRENGILKIDIEELFLPSDFIMSQHYFVSLPPKSIGGNHTHPRREIIISLNPEVELHWIDAQGKRHIERAWNENSFWYFDIHPHVPHALVNVSEKSYATIWELADAPQTDVKFHHFFQDEQNIQDKFCGSLYQT